MSRLGVLLACLLAVAALSGGWAVAGNHCGAAGDWRSKLIPDQWPPPEARRGWAAKLGSVDVVPVYRACKRHDDCYDTPGPSREQCDERFLADMRAECEAAYQNILETPLKEACYQAAEGYYNAVSKFGEPAFAAARKGRAVRTAPRAEPASIANAEATRQSSGQGRNGGAQESDVVQMRPWGKLSGAVGIAAMHGELYAYDSAAGLIWRSGPDSCQWEEFCKAPKATLLAAGQGRLFLWDKQSGELYSAHINKKQWQRLGRIDGVGSLACCGAKLVCRLSDSGDLLASSPAKLNWRKIGRLADPAVVTGFGGKLYALNLKDKTLDETHLNKLNWQDGGRLSRFGLPAVQGGDIHLLDPASGEIFKN